jgi:hypothetical protein
MKKQIVILSVFAALLFSMFITSTLTSCKTKQTSVTTYENTKDSTKVSTEKINALDSLKINDSTTIKIIDEKVISSFSNGRTTEITLDSSALFTLASILDGTAYLPVTSLKITEANTSDLTTSKVTTDKSIAKDITSVKRGLYEATDSTSVNDSTIATIETSKSVSGGGFMWGIRVAIIVGVLLLLIFLYFRLKK